MINLIGFLNIVDKSVQQNINDILNWTNQIDGDIIFDQSNGKSTQFLVLFIKVAVQ